MQGKSLQYGYDYAADYTKRAFSFCLLLMPLNTISEYNSGLTFQVQFDQHAEDKCQWFWDVVQIGLETTVNGKEIAIQQLNVQSLVGRMI